MSDVSAFWCSRFALTKNREAMSDTGDEEEIAAAEAQFEAHQARLRQEAEEWNASRPEREAKAKAAMDDSIARYRAREARKAALKAELGDAWYGFVDHLPESSHDHDAEECALDAIEYLRKFPERVEQLLGEEWVVMRADEIDYRT
jgi:hypothetical protein